MLTRILLALLLLPALNACSEPPPSTTGLHQDCAASTCADGQTCVAYYGVAGTSGPQFHSCEIPCTTSEDCPTDYRCLTVADGPGRVCWSAAN